MTTTYRTDCRVLRGPVRALVLACAGVAALGLASGTAAAQTYGFATLPPGTLNYTTASAIAKVLKEKAGMNVLVQPTAGDQVIIPLVSRGEAEIGIANAPELHNAYEGKGAGGKLTDLRLIGTAHTLLTAFFVRKDSPAKTIADMKGKRVTTGYSAMRVIDTLTRAMLATAGLDYNNIKQVPVPNVIRSADDFVSGSADMFFFAFGAPKVREVDATVGGIRVLEIDDKGMPAARKISKWGFLVPVKPGPIFVGVDKPMKVYAFDNVLFTNSKVPDEFVYKFLDTLVKNKPDLVAVQPVLRGFSAENAYKQYDVPYHPGAIKYYKEHNLQPKALQ